MEMGKFLRRAVLGSILGGGAMWMGFDAAGVGPDIPPRLSVDPNAIVSSTQVMRVFADGVARGSTIHLAIYQDCNGDGHADRKKDGDCENPLFEKEVIKGEQMIEGCQDSSRALAPTAKSKDSYLFCLNFTLLKSQGIQLPRGPLWLAARRPGSTVSAESYFGLVDKECSLFASIIQLFFRTECQPGPARVLNQQGRAADLEKTVFEVQRYRFAADTEPMTVSGTRGATGVEWFDQKTLLVTRGATGEAPAGLYRVKLDSGEATQLWNPSQSEVPVAPFRLKDGRIAFARQEPGNQEPDESAVVATLVVLDAGQKILQQIPLPFKLHQILAADPQEKSLLALSLGIGGAEPTLLRIDLDTGQVVNLGFSSALYSAAMQRPQGQGTLVAYEASRRNKGWEVAICTEEPCEKAVVLLQRQGVDDLAPSWKLDGSEFVFLSGKRGLEKK